MRTEFRFFIIFILSMLCLPSSAKVRLPHVLCDNMVLQQQTDARVWGWARPGSTVTVTPSWSSNAVSVKADKNGNWLTSVKTPKASYTPLSLTFDDGDGQVVLNNILAGEVWVCAGQSNMEFPVAGFTNCPLEGYNETVADAGNARGIRYVKIPSVMSTKPLNDADCHWDVVDATTVGNCSAVGYFFARKVNQMLNIPVGLVLANKGGSRVESWLDRDNLKKYTDDPLDSVEMVKKFKYDYHRPLLWGNGTFHPILNYTVKGILFYQGCSNVGDPGDRYSERLKLLVEQWRRDFKEGDIPFYFVQLVPYKDGDGLDGTSRALMYEQQLRASVIIPNSDVICTNDLVYPYEATQIHPCQKKPVGERLAYLALTHDYGVKSIIAESPRYKSMTVQDGKCYLKFDHMDGGYSRFEDIQGFEVAGADKVFHTAKAVHFWVEGNDPRNETIEVSSPEVSQPVAVRYCFRNFKVGNLKNAGGLPLFPFRTDKW